MRDTVLYRTVERYWPEFVDRTQEVGTLPAFVKREFDDYLKCGLLEHGFARCMCQRCGLEHRVPLSCKRRGFCPSCVGRRMNDTAIHLVDEVFPAVPVRQWVVTVPWSLKYRFGYDRKACALLSRTFNQALGRLMRRKAKAELGLSSVTEAHPGAVTFVQRSDAALRLSPHLHVLSLDGVYVRDRAGKLVFHRLTGPTEAEPRGLRAKWPSGSCAISDPKRSARRTATSTTSPFLRTSTARRRQARRPWDHGKGGQ